MTVILPFSAPSVSSVPFLFQIPRTVTGVSTTSPRVKLQVKVRSRPWKKLVFRGDPEMMGGGGITAYGRNKMNVGTMIVQQLTSNRNICCANSRNIYSSLWDVEPGSAGVSPSMTGPQRGEGEERRC